jgi:hypothetical protein
MMVAVGRSFPRMEPRELQVFKEKKVIKVILVIPVQPDQPEPPVQPDQPVLMGLTVYGDMVYNQLSPQ